MRVITAMIRLYLVLLRIGVSRRATETRAVRPLVKIENCNLSSCPVIYFRISLHLAYTPRFGTRS